MLINNKLVGKTVTLRCAEITDAEFILSLRNDIEISKYLPKLEISVAQQREWINAQRNNPHDFYFIIEDINDQTQLGTISIYDLAGSEAESGRFASLGDPIQNVESGLILYDFAFYQLNLTCIKSWVFKENSGVLIYNRKFGFTFVEGVSNTGIPIMIGNLTKNSYKLASEKFRMFFDNL